MEVAANCYTPAVLTLTTATGRDVRPLDPSHGHDGLCFPAAHVAQLVADGRSDSPLLPLAASVRMMETMDEIRRQLPPA